MTLASSPDTDREVSPATARARAFVDARRDRAQEMGRDLATLLDDPERLAHVLRTDLEALADPVYAAGQRLVAPGIGDVAGVRNPLLTALGRGFLLATRRASPAQLLQVADRLVREQPLEMRWLAFRVLDRLVGTEPERAWQLLRLSARQASDWITVDSLAHPCARGILLEPFRWAELEQLVFSPSPWERRLVGSTIAVMPFVDREAGRTPAVAEHGLAVVAELIGDADPEVQKALAWALRSLSVVDQGAVTAFCVAEAALARADDDGSRAWVIRDTLARLEPADASRLRGMLAGLRRRSGAPSTSRAAATANRFGPLPDPARHPEPPR